MFDRETILRLVAGLIVAILIHTVLVPTLGVALRNVYFAGPGASGDDATDAVWPSEPEQEKPNLEAPRPELKKVTIGRGDEPWRITAAWIPYDDFYDLMAVRDKLDQPALQNKVDSVPQAFIQMEATDSSQVEQSAAGQASPRIVPSSQEPAVAGAHGAHESAETMAPWVPHLIEPAAVRAITGPTEEVQSVPVPRTLTRSQVAGAEAKRPNTSGPVLRPPSPEAREKRPHASTAAPRSNRESVPVTRMNMRRRQIGRVTVSEGLELLPVRARPGVVTRRSTAPRDAKGRIVIDRTGRVIQAELLRSTGYGGWDSAILRSLYKWRAEGPMLETIENRTIIEIYFDF